MFWYDFSNASVECDGCDGDSAWYHPECLGIPADFKLKSIKIFCKRCCKKKGMKEYDLVIEKKERGKAVVLKRRIGFDHFEEPKMAKKVKGVK